MINEILLEFIKDYAIGEAFGVGKHEMIDEGGINDRELLELQFDRKAWASAVTAILTERKMWDIYDSKYIINHSKIVMCAGDTSGHIGQGATLFFRRIAEAIIRLRHNLPSCVKQLTWRIEFFVS
jgi:hypothetical protein